MKIPQGTTTRTATEVIVFRARGFRADLIRGNGTDVHITLSTKGGLEQPLSIGRLRELQMLIGDVLAEIDGIGSGDDIT
jgi:hypothetical protein